MLTVKQQLLKKLTIIISVTGVLLLLLPGFARAQKKGKPLVNWLLAFTCYITARQGTGLGLPLSYYIVKAHGGSITIDTQEGKYTVFNMRLPL